MKWIFFIMVGVLIYKNLNWLKYMWKEYIW